MRKHPTEREREHAQRLHRSVNIKDPVAVVDFLEEMRIYLYDIRRLADEATLPPRERVCTRRYLRSHIFASIDHMEARLDVVAPTPGIFRMPEKEGDK